MADFVQTMKDWRRMCDTIKSCDDCPMHKEDGWTYVLCSEGGISSARPEVAEKVIVKWAAEHPVIYPTWGEYLISKGLLMPYWNERGTAPYDMYIYAERALANPINAETAQKLGIEPKEGV